MLGYRVENVEGQNGLWRNFDGTWNPVFGKLSDGQARSMPMEDNDLYRHGGKQWFSAAPSKETLKHWFSLQDVIELEGYGYRVYEFELGHTEHVSDFELIFTRDNILRQTEINKEDIWQ